MIEINEASNILSEIKIITFLELGDSRGVFTKYYEKNIQKSFNFKIDEVFISTSKKDVIRGMHLQSKSHSLKKIVLCLEGSITDVVVDLRDKSTTYGDYIEHELNQESPVGIFVPEGFGHGFKVNSENAKILYLQSGDYNSDSEIGINPLSLGYNWNIEFPNISERDLALPKLKDFRYK